MKRSIGARTLLYPTPVMVIGTYDSEDRPNVMVAAWGGICSSSPPSLCVSVRTNRLTYENLVSRREFTISIPSENYVCETDFFGLTGGKETNKFEITGLTPAQSSRVHAPFVKEFPVILDCQVIQVNDLGAHTQFIGEILDVNVDEELMTNGEPDIEKIKPFLYSTDNSSYYAVGRNLGKAFSLGRKFKKK